MKKLFAFLSIILIAILFWLGFALWTGIYSVYSFPPGKEYPNGATLIVSRENGEPMFNSPDYVEPKKPVDKEKGIGFGKTQGKKRPLSIRTVAKLPYIVWAYRRSLEQQVE